MAHMATPSAVAGRPGQRHGDRARATASAEEAAPVPDADHPAHAGLGRPGHGTPASRSAWGSTAAPSPLRALPRSNSVGLLEVAVGVEPLDHRLVTGVAVAPGGVSSLRRGKSGAPFSTGRPPG